MAKQKLAFLGLGVMGFPMAGHLLKLGHDLCVYNRTTEKAERWLAHYKAQYADAVAAGLKLSTAPTPAAAAEGADYIFTCLGADKDVEQVIAGEDGVLKSLKAGALIVDHSTISSKMTRSLAVRVAKHQGSFMDAPVSGGEAGAVAGALTVMCGGTQADYQRAEVFLKAYGKMVRQIGDIGAGQEAKMVNQICIAATVQGLAEALHFAEKAGLDTKRVIETIEHGAAGSWQMSNRARTMIEGRFDFGFAVDLMRKDLAIVLEAAREKGARLPVTALVDQFYGDIQAANGGRLDTSSLIKRFEPS